MQDNYLPLLLTDTRVHGNTGKSTLAEQAIQLGRTNGALDEDDYLIVVLLVEDVVQAAILLGFAQLDVVLRETVKRELGLIVDVDLQRVLHELLADRANLLAQSGREHHNLLLLRCGAEDLLDIAAHVCDSVLAADRQVGFPGPHTNLIKHLVALVQDEFGDTAKTQLLLADQSLQTAWGGDDDVGMRLLVGENLLILLDVRAAVEHLGLDFGHVLAEALVLVANLEGELAGVAHDEDRRLSGDGLDLLERAKHEDCRLPETGLGLADDVGAEDGLRDAALLDCGSIVLELIRQTFEACKPSK